MYSAVAGHDAIPDGSSTGESFKTSMLYTCYIHEFSCNIQCGRDSYIHTEKYEHLHRVET